jgi:hypothetical protein
MCLQVSRNEYTYKVIQTKLFLYNIKSTPQDCPTQDPNTTHTAVRGGNSSVTGISKLADLRANGVVLKYLAIDCSDSPGLELYSGPSEMDVPA